MQRHEVVLVVLLVLTTAVWTAPTLPILNQVQGTKTGPQLIPVGHDGQTNDADEEEQELELERLKGHTNLDIPQISPTTSTSTSTMKSTAPKFTKKPENEEAPAISDNANSLKFPHQQPNGFDESLVSLFSKKDGHKLHTNQHNEFGGQLGRSSIGNGWPSVNNEEQQMELGGLMGDLLLGEREREHEQSHNFQQGADYTPQDIAEYVFWTGDERGVAGAMADFLQEGLVSREDAVRFLEDAKRELNTIRNRYTSAIMAGQTRHGQQIPEIGQGVGHKDFLPIQDGYAGYHSTGLGSFPAKRESLPQMNLPASDLFLNEPFSFNHGKLNPIGPGSSSNLVSVEELDYDEIAEKLRTVDAKMREIALEDVIYQIGKDLFAQSLNSGDSTQKFSEFVESHAANGKIPKDLEKDVLDALVEAFVDAVDERGTQQLELEHQLQEQKPNSAKLLQEGKQGVSKSLGTTPPKTSGGKNTVS